MPLLSLLPILLLATSITLSWDPHPDTAVSGYRVHWGTASGTYTSHAPVAGRATTSYTVSGLPPGSYYFAVTATSADAESGYSNEVTYIVSTPPPVPPTGLRITNVTASAAKLQSHIRWTTNLPSSSRVYYGAAGDSLTSSRSVVGTRTSHTVSITDLRRRTLYRYMAVSLLPDGREARSGVLSFTTR